MFGIEITVDDLVALLPGRAQQRQSYQPLDEAAVVEAAEALVAVQRQAVEQMETAARVVAQAAALVDRPPVEQRQTGAIHSTVPASVARRARQVLEQNPLFLDYETTGLRKSAQVREVDGRYPTTATAGQHQVIEVSVIDANGRHIFHSRVNPLRPVPAKISAMNGLTNDQVANAPAWAEVAPLLRQTLAGRVVVAHNAGFEALFTPPEWGITWVCSKALADEAFGRYHWSEASDWRKGGSLAARLRQCGLQPGPAHTAAGDGLSALRLMRFLAGLEQLSN